VFARTVVVQPYGVPRTAFLVYNSHGAGRAVRVGRVAWACIVTLPDDAAMTMGSSIGVPLFFCAHPEQVRPCTGAATTARSADGFELRRYLGEWEVAWRAPTWFEDGVDVASALSDHLLHDSVAAYSPGADATVMIVNNYLVDLKGQMVSSVEGTARRVDNTTLEFLVQFDTPFGCVPGVYRILDYGIWDDMDATPTARYQYAIVAGATTDHVWVLVRNVESALGSAQHVRQLRRQLARVSINEDTLLPTPKARAATRS